MKKNVWRWLGAMLLASMVMAGAVTTLAQVPPGFEPQVQLLNSEGFTDNSANDSGESGLISGEAGAGEVKAGGFKSWLADRGMGLVKGIGAGLIGAAVVVGVAALVVGAGAPLLLMAGAAVVGGALYGLFTGSANFNWTEAIVGSVIGGVSAGVGSWIAGMGGSILTRAGVAAVDMIGGGLANTVSYLIHSPNPTGGGAATAFGVGAGTAAVFMGAGATISKGWKWAKGALGFGRPGNGNPGSGVVKAALIDDGVPGAKAASESSVPTRRTNGVADNRVVAEPSNTAGSSGQASVETPAKPAPEVTWPPNRGFHGTPAREVLVPGTRIDRFGHPGGTFVSPEGTPFEARALPAEYLDSKPYHVYEVVEPIEVAAGPIEPWFGQPGMGTQYELPKSVLDLIKDGVLREVKRS